MQLPHFHGLQIMAAPNESSEDVNDFLQRIRELGERRGRRRRAREAHGRRRARWPFGVVERVREAGAPAIRVGLVRARREQQRRRTHQ